MSEAFNESANANAPNATYETVNATQQIAPLSVSGVQNASAPPPPPHHRAHNVTRINVTTVAIANASDPRHNTTNNATRNGAAALTAHPPHIVLAYIVAAAILMSA